MLRPSARSKLRGTSAGSGACRQATGSNSERSARSARFSSRAAAAAGSRPVRGRTRPRYLIRSARVQVPFSCWASATAFCAAWLSLFFGGARLEVRCLRELRELALGRRAAVALLEPRGAGAQVGGDGFAAGGEQPHHLAGDAFYLEAVAVVAGGPLQAEPLRQGFLEVLGDDRGDRADVLVVAQRVRGSPFAVSA